jgi:hypothetical protein
LIIVRRVFTGVVESFPVRASEWLLSIAMIWWGFILLDETPIFASSPVYGPMASLFAEETWGLMAVLAGFVRLLALVINGTFSGTLYSFYSPHIRCTMSFITCFIWAQISLGFQASGVVTTGMAVYPILFLLDAWNAVRAAGDAGAMRAARSSNGAL